MIELKYFNIFFLFIGIWCVNVDGMSITTINDVTIEIDGNLWRCDRIKCPVGTMFCEVKKYTTNTEPNTLHRQNFCYSENGKILLEQSTAELVPPNERHQLYLKTNRHGNTVSSSAFGGGIAYQGSSILQDDTSMANINIPNIQIPKIQIPNFVIPSIRIPPFTMPEIIMQPVEIPEVTFPDITMPDFMENFMEGFTEGK